MANTPIVRHISESFIKPKYEVEDAINPLYFTPEELLMLSTDYIKNGLLFSKPSDNQDPMNRLVDNLKHSLSVALVHFYPLAGQLVTEVDEDQHTSLVYIDCKKGPGAGFIHAAIDMSVSDIVAPEHVPPVVEWLFDHRTAVNHDGHTRPLLSIQVTELVDGVFIGCSMNHACGDGTSFWHLFNTLSEIFMAADDGESNVVISRPPIHNKWFVKGVGPIIKIPYTRPDEFISRYEQPPEVTERIFRFSAESIKNIKAKANQDCGGNNNISSFQALAALVWRSITRARCLPDDVETQCRFSVDIRRRLEPPLSSNYFGSAVLMIRGSTKVGELLSQKVGWAASLLHQAVVEHSTNEKVRMQMKQLGESPFVVKVGAFDHPCVVHIGSSPRFDVYANEFGMGKGLAVLRGSAIKFDGKIMGFPGRHGGGSIDLHICLRSDYMRAIEADEELINAISGP